MPTENITVCVLLFVVIINKVKEIWTNTFVVDKDVAVKSIPEQHDILSVFKIDICSWKKVGIQTAIKKEGKK